MVDKPKMTDHNLESGPSFCHYYRCEAGQKSAIRRFKQLVNGRKIFEKIEVEGKEINVLGVQTSEKSGYIDHNLRFIAETPEGKYVYTGQVLSLRELRRNIGRTKFDPILEEFKKQNS